MPNGLMSPLPSRRVAFHRPGRDAQDDGLSHSFRGTIVLRA